MGVSDSESVNRTSAGSRNMAEMRMRKGKSAISPQRVIRSTSCLVQKINTLWKLVLSKIYMPMSLPNLKCVSSFIRYF